MPRPVSPVDELEREFVAQMEEEGASRTGQFGVEIDGEVVTGWQRVNLPVVSTDGVTKQGDDRATETDQQGESEQILLEMERDISSETDRYVWSWLNDLRQGNVEKSRRDVVITLEDDDGNPSARWKFTECWPKTYEPPDFGVDASESTERLTLVSPTYEQLEVEFICGHDLSKITQSYSRATDALEGPLRSLVTNATVHGTVAGDEDRHYTIRTDSNGAITTVLDQPPAAPDLIVETDCETLTRIITADDPQASLRTAYEDDDVRVRGTGIISGIMTGILDTVTTIADMLS